MHIALNQLCHLVTYHGPMPASDMLKDFDHFSKESFLQAITSPNPTRNNRESAMEKKLSH